VTVRQTRASGSAAVGARFWLIAAAKWARQLGRLPSGVTRYGRLSQRQLEVLQWVASGSPDGVWTALTYKTVAYGLAGRHLVVVERRRNSWRASITAQGTYYLQHGRYPPAGTPDRRRPPSQDTAAPERIGPSVSVSPRSLIDQLQADGIVTLTDPTAFTRAAYRSAISRAITEGLVPDGYALRHSGRDRGDLVIRLVVASELPVPAEKLPEIVLPENLVGCHEVMRMLGGPMTSFCMFLRVPGHARCA
jgi:hypothetical protein